MTSNHDPSILSPDRTLPPSNPPSQKTFPFPRDYHFPPYFTRQPTLTTRHAQLQKWSSLILSYCRYHKIWKLSLADAIESDLFWNKKLGKRLSREDAREVLEFMRKEGRSEAVGGKDGSVFWVWWRDPEEWAGLIADWVDDTAQKNTVLTLYELTESEATLSQDFHGMDPDLLQKALSILVKRGKAQVFGQEDQQGVKFF
ncbi:ESCRT-II complex, vps25 subunit [Mollisia scopiformis]|uniref:Vacuolar protein-sorting-associated protein 25 n=1 Tax=Mollisia scopiformis TaxID=149040 RepID=A0A194XKD4_MOLSC|nr:ESCRT-II complex, vps25 subunit [Mollisia scopiformis]KUJ20569.1 ESCRT-II complex, vps25 subunit [Mollisia scopiformis]